jgi:hypothetical protein
MTTAKPLEFVVTGIKTGKCIACEKETRVFEVVFREQAMTLCQQDFSKQVRIACAGSTATAKLAGHS